MNQRKISDPESTPHHCCPITGLPILQRPEWTDIKIGPNYTVTFKYIGKRILLSIPRGNSNHNRLDVLLRERAKVLDAMLGPDEPFFELKDFSQTKQRKDKSKNLISLFSKRKFPKTDRIIGFIAYNVPQVIKLAMNVKSGLHNTRYPRSFVDDYATAVKGAVEALKQYDYILIKGTEENNSITLPIGGGAPEKPLTLDSARTYANELVSYIGSINWHSNESGDNIREIDPSHPFSPAYDAISLIKMELNSLLHEKSSTEKALRESAEIYRGMFENSTSFVYSIDLKGNFTDVNPAAEPLTGYQKDELIGMNFRDFIHRNYQRKAIKAFFKLYNSEKGLKDLLFEVIVKGGEKNILRPAHPLQRKETRKSVFRAVYGTLPNVKTTRRP